MRTKTRNLSALSLAGGLLMVFLAGSPVGASEAASPVTHVSSTASSLCTSVASAPTGSATKLAGEASGNVVEPQAIPVAECTRIYNIRSQACGIIPTPRIRAICYAEAMEEYARCLTGATSEPSRLET